MMFGAVAQAAALVAFAGGVIGTTSATALAATSEATVIASAPTDSTAIHAPAAAPQASRPFAAPEAVNAPTAPTAGGLAQVTFALLIVLVAIFAVAWVARRMRGFNNRVGGAIDVLADVPLGQKERAVLLKVGNQQILLGVAPGRVNTLHVLPEPLELAKPPAPDVPGGPTFRNILMRSLGK